MDDKELQNLFQMLVTTGCTEKVLAEIVAKMIGDDWRFIREENSWKHYTGKRWEKAYDLDLTNPVTTCFRELRNISFTEEQIKQNPAIEKVKKYLLSCENSNRITNCIRLLKAELIASIEKFDCKLNLLNLNDCTLNLETWSARSHRREDYLTQISPASFTGGYGAELWEKTIKEVLPDADTRRYFQKFMGYCLGGNTEAEKFIVLYGSGGGGKGTIMETIAAAIGRDYVVSLSVNALLAGQRLADGSAHTSEIGKLKGKRMVLSSETSKGSHFDDAKIKLLTGSDTVTARMPHGLPFDYRPQFKLTIQTNFLPAIEDIFDNGMKRRLVIIPFDSKIAVRNERLKKELLQNKELDACFRWLWEGWKMYQKEGLPDYDSPEFPAKMKAVMTDFYQQNDTFADFIAECFYPEKDCTVKASVAFDIYKRWSSGDRAAVGRKTFFNELRKRGYKKIHKVDGDYIEGLQENLCVKV